MKSIYPGQLEGDVGAVGWNGWGLEEGLGVSNDPALVPGRDRADTLGGSPGSG